MALHEPDWLVRVVEVYSNESEELVARHRLPPVPLAELQRRWGQPPTEPLVAMFPVSPNQAPFLAELLGIAFDTTRFSYFLTAVTTDLAASRRSGGFMGAYPPPLEPPASTLRAVEPKSGADPEVD